MEGFENVVSFPSLIARLTDKKFLESEDESCQFVYENEYVAVGDLVRDQQLRSSKALNLSVEEREFELLVISSAVHANLSGTINLACGFPDLTFEQNMKLATSYNGRQLAWEDPTGRKSISIKRVVSFRESIGHAVGLKHEMAIPGKLLSISIGYGTVESVLLREDGQPIKNSIHSMKSGIRHAVKEFRRRLLNDYAIREPDSAAGNEQIYDEWLYRSYHGSKVPNLNSNKGIIPQSELKEIADQVLERYANETLKPHFRALLDSLETDDLRFAVTGGGSIYAPVQDVAKAAADMHNVSYVYVPRELAMKSAALGYKKIIEMAADPGTYLISDFGNSNTVCTSLAKGNTH